MKKIQPITEAKLLEYHSSIISFLQEQYILSDGSLIKLQDWQKQVLIDIFDTKDEQGGRKYNMALVGLPKKNGKSVLASGIAIYKLFCGGINSEIASVAFDSDQARIIFDMARKSIERNPILLSSVKIYHNRIYVPATDSSYEVVPNEHLSIRGRNFSTVIFDEAQAFGMDRKLLDALAENPTRPDSLMYITSYASAGKNAWLYDLYERGLSKRDDKFYMMWSHDNLSEWVTGEYLKRQEDRLPTEIYQQLHQNQFVDGSANLITKEELRKCTDCNLTPKLGGQKHKYYLGLDLGISKDKTAVCVVHRDDTDNLIYLDYIRTFAGTKQSPVMISDVEQELLMLNRNFNIKMNVFDPWQLKSVSQRLKGKIKIEEFNFTTTAIQRLSQNLHYLFRNSLIRIFSHKELEDELLSMIVETKSYGWRVNHPPSGHSDHCIALGMASLYAVQNKKPTAGVLISESPTFEEFQEQVKKEKQSKVKVTVGVNRTEHNQNKFPQLSQLEAWRRTMKL
ncbi:MAG: terminase large subunit domain-containing protein [Anaerolineaceae bacterium]